jgi:hypothetical protein
MFCQTAPPPEPLMEASRGGHVLWRDSSYGVTVELCTSEDLNSAKFRELRDENVLIKPSRQL